MVRGLDIELDENGNIPGLPSFYLPMMDKETRREAEADEETEADGTESGESRSDAESDDAE